MATGRFALAEAEYLALADGAQAAGLPQGPSLLVAAGMSALEAGEVARGMEHFLRGLEGFRLHGQIQRCEFAASRIMAALESRGHRSEADRISGYVDHAGLQVRPPEAAGAGPRRLPVQCPQCGGRVHPDEVDWVDSHSAVCAYCGSVLLAEA